MPRSTQRNSVVAWMTVGTRAPSFVWNYRNAELVRQSKWHETAKEPQPLGEMGRESNQVQIERGNLQVYVELDNNSSVWGAAGTRTCAAVICECILDEIQNHGTERGRR